METFNPLLYSTLHKEVSDDVNGESNTDLDLESSASVGVLGKLIK